MSRISDVLYQDFQNRAEKVLDLIRESGIAFEQVGVFGSYARDEYKSGSDVDFCIITDERPGRAVSGELREEAESFGADIIYVTPEYFDHDQSLFAQNLRRDYRRLL